MMHNVSMDERLYTTNDLFFLYRRAAISIGQLLVR